MRQLPVLIITGCVLVLGGCAGRPRHPDSQIRERFGTAVPDSGKNGLSNHKIELSLSDYGRRLVGMHDRDWRDMALYIQEDVPDVEWLNHFGQFLEPDTEAEDDVETVSAANDEAREALVKYMIEKIYPVRTSLRVIGRGRRFLLGDYIDSYIRDMELRRSNGGFELIYKRDF